MGAEESRPLPCELCAEPWAHEYYHGRELLHRYCEWHDQAATREVGRVLALAYADELAVEALGPVARVSVPTVSLSRERERPREGGPFVRHDSGEA